MVLSGYNRKTLSKATGLSRNTISTIISGQQNPSYRAMNLLFETLRLSPEEATEIFFNRNLRNMQDEEAG
ncbi:XRE family transcriptional regulator [Sporolactobacillus shoreae]|uniref:XRE family transcriptional regulator n=2 Tax=Sporolactobacillus shoreae TaxID=1465501 RepID=A0A4Z0GK14_9BACL|nr:XRE family transcriptional regulator [Sporolactobacillus shoreae]